jgi:hypothetical protein
MGIALLTSAASARAAGCQTEIEKLCKDQTPIMTCLRAHEKDLSKECDAYLRFFERMPSCVADARRLCPTKKPSGAKIIACLRGRQTDLSEDCRKEIGNMR